MLYRQNGQNRIKLGPEWWIDSRISSITGNPMPVVSVTEAARLILEELGIEKVLTPFEQAYLDGKHNQVCTGRVIGVAKKDLPKCPQLSYKGQDIIFEGVESD